MILLERTYVLMGDAVARDLLALSGVNAKSVSLDALHRLLREHCPSSWHPLLDTLLVIHQTDMEGLARRFQQEVADMDSPLRLGQGADVVVPRSIVLWFHPELADRPNACLTEVLGRQQGGSVTVVDDDAVIDATIAFNRHLRDHVDHGLSARAAVH